MKADENLDLSADGFANENLKPDLSQRLEKLRDAMAKHPPTQPPKKPLFSDDELRELKAREQAPWGPTRAQIRRMIKPRYLRQ